MAVILMTKWSNYNHYRYEKIKNDSNNDYLIVSFDAYQAMVNYIISDIQSKFKNPEEIKNSVSITGIARGGLPLLTHVSNRLSSDFSIINYQTRDGNSKYPKLITDSVLHKYVIIVEDIIDTGKTINEVLKMKELQDKIIFVYSLFYKINVEVPKDVQIKTCIDMTPELNHWIIFPWEQ